MAGSWASWVKAQGVVVAGDAKYPICMKTASDNSTAVAFTVDDFIGELNDINGMGSQKQVTELNGYRYPSSAKVTGRSTPNDVTLVLNLTSADLTLLRGYYSSDQKLAVGIFDNSANSYGLLYGLIGTISQWGMEVPNGDGAQLTITMAIINDSVAHTFSA